MQQALTDLIGLIALPAFLLVILAMMAGAKPDTLVRPFFGLITTIIGGLLRILELLIKEIFSAIRSTGKKKQRRR